MKTLLVYFNVDSFAIQLRDNVISALKEMRIEHRVCHITSLERETKDFEPVMTILFHPNNLYHEYADLIKDTKGHKLVWSMEDPWEIELTRTILNNGVYYAFTFDELSANTLDKEFPNRVKFVPHACNPKIHHTYDYDYIHRSDVLFIGNAYPSRIDWFIKNAPKFKNKYVTIIGVGYRGMPGYEKQNIIDGHVDPDEMFKYISGAKLVLNLHRQKDDLNVAKSDLDPVSYNNRYYEVASIGKKQLLVGRGEDHEFKPKNVGKFRKENSYKKRLEDNYLNLIS